RLIEQLGSQAGLRACDVCDSSNLVTSASRECGIDRSIPGGSSASGAGSGRRSSLCGKTSLLCLPASLVLVILRPGFLSLAVILGLPGGVKYDHGGSFGHQVT